MPKERAEWTEKDGEKGFRSLGVMLTKEEFMYMREISEVNNTSMSKAARNIFLHSKKNVVNYSLGSINTNLEKLSREIEITKGHVKTLEKLVGKETV